MNAMNPGLTFSEHLWSGSHDSNPNPHQPLKYGLSKQDWNSCRKCGTFRIWILLLRIRIRRFRLNMVPVPIRIRNQGFDDLTLKIFIDEKFFLYLLDQKLLFTYP
jgi:hypothetical protein